MGRGGFEPPTQGVPVFKTDAISHSATYQKAEKGIEPLPGVLQTLAIPLCYSARLVYIQGGRTWTCNLLNPNQTHYHYATPIIILGLIGLEPTMPKHGFTIRCNNQLCHNPKIGPGGTRTHTSNMQNLRSTVKNYGPICLEEELNLFNKILINKLY